MMGVPDKEVPQISGLYAAMPTPFRDDGVPDLEAIDPIVDFLIDAGLEGLCVSGATGEYPACSIRERELLFQRVAARTKGRVRLIFGIGAGNAGQVRYLANVALDCGGCAVLLPPPFYYRYDAGDLAEFIRSLGQDLPLPVLIYYIPQFTNPFDIRDALQLIETVPNIIGIKDSSGRRENPSLLAEAKSRVPMAYLCGDDSLLIDALHHGADGAISGVASACPELLMAIEKVRRCGGGVYSSKIQELLDEFISQIDAFPAPWGIKLAMETRGLQMGPLSWSGGRQLNSRIEAFRQWFRGWLPSCLEACATEAPPAERT